jgi:methylmalonyl-CoA/ethylmalonyl-CoA epimerase
MKLHHVGVIVANIERQGAQYARVLALAPQSPPIEDPIQKVMVQFWGLPGETPLELIQPLSPESPAARALQKGGGLNHLAFEVADLDSSVQDAIAKGAICTCEAVPAVAFGGRRIAFVFYRDVGLIEFIESGQDGRRSL